MQIAICDDEAVTRELLAEKVREFDKEAQIEFYENGENLLLQKQEPDILFLDIQMPGRNGMEIAKELRKKWRNVILIFVTAIEEYVFEAFDVGAFHYLIKPLTDEKFEEVIKKAVEQLDSKKLPKKPEQDEKYMMIDTQGSHIKIPVSEIVYAEVFNRKVMLHTINDVIEYYGKLSDLEKSLGEDFFRPHRAYLVHFKYVVKYTATSISLKNGTALMAKANFGEFVQKYLKYNQRKGKEIE